MACFEPSEVSNHLIDLVVKNFGTTGARDVMPTSNPKLKHSIGTGKETEDVWMFDRLPLLAPGQEWRTFFDSGLSRKETDLPARYELALNFNDMRGRKVDPVESVLDLSMYTGRMWTEIYTIHHAAKALREIEKSVKQWGERTGSGLKVVVRDGDAIDERRRQELANHRARLDALRQQGLAGQSNGENGKRSDDSESAVDTGPGTASD
ncbi:hypothetical protein GCM10023170_094700 [Phytohabitans houttuyneae]|uniref:Uncharacterized protein n=2 Tax=Phytohabitans houttuyneae TaxID=1076126 RepID=A0A6V8K5V4_9ACTN|nr:hypothetical protein Phou_015460 [Phytohabitans houttuyneae]